MTKKVRTVKGMHDLLPGDLAKIEYIQSLFLETARKYGFNRVQTPTLEFDEVYKSTSEFPEERCYSLADSKGRKLILRSDPDAPLVRLVATHFRYAPKPIKLAFCGNIFRSWNPRRREFRMFSINTFGIDGPAADAEILRVIADVVDYVGFPGYWVEFNNLQIFRSIIIHSMSQSDRNDDVDDIIYDMRFAQDSESIIKILDSRHLPRHIIDDILLILECGSDETKAYNVLVKLSGDFPSLIPELDKTLAFRESLIGQGIRHAHLNVVNFHGTGFYSGFTYRIFPKKGSKEIGDGGRYDHMMQKMHNDPMPATGIGLGIERFIELMEANHCSATFPTKPKGILISYAERALAIRCRPVLKSLRSAGCVIEEDLASRDFDKIIRYARSKEHSRVVIVGASKEEERLHLKIVNLGNSQAELLVARNQEELLGILLEC